MKKYIIKHKLIGLNYLRVVAVLMILYDHLGGFRNKQWIYKRIIDIFCCNPLNIIQDFGAFGVSIFFLLSGFLFVHNQKYDKILKKTISICLSVWLTSLFCFLLFLIVQILLNKIQFFTYWHQFTLKQWKESISLLGYFNGNGEVIICLFFNFISKKYGIFFN